MGHFGQFFGIATAATGDQTIAQVQIHAVRCTPNGSNQVPIDETKQICQQIQDSIGTDLDQPSAGKPPQVDTEPQHGDRHDSQNTLGSGKIKDRESHGARNANEKILNMEQKRTDQAGNTESVKCRTTDAKDRVDSPQHHAPQKGSQCQQQEAPLREILGHRFLSESPLWKSPRPRLRLSK